MRQLKDFEGDEIYDLVLGNRVTLIALLEILEEKGVLKKEEVFGRVLEVSAKEEKENAKPTPIRRAA